MKRKLVAMIHALAICSVIAVLAWSKTKRVTVTIPFFPHRKQTCFVPMRDRP